MRYVLVALGVLLAAQASGQIVKVLPDTSLTTTSSDSVYTIPGNQAVTFDLLDMPDATFAIESDTSVDLGRAYKVSIVADGEYEVNFKYFGGNSPGIYQEVFAVVNLTTASKVTLFVWIKED